MHQLAERGGGQATTACLCDVQDRIRHNSLTPDLLRQRDMNDGIT